MNNAINGFTHTLDGRPIPPRRTVATPTPAAKRTKRGMEFTLAKNKKIIALAPNGTFRSSTGREV